MKPQIVCHMMSSVDGRLLPERYSLPFDGKTMDEVAKPYFDISFQLDGQALLIGRKTVQEYYQPKTFDHQQLPPATNFVPFAGKRGAERPIIVIDPKGKILYEIDPAKDDTFITILGEGVSEAYLTDLRAKNVSYLFAGRDGTDIAKAMDTLGTEFGFTRILLEGGGIINGTFLKAELIDELSLTMYPGIDGLASSPTIFDYVGQDGEHPAGNQSLELISVETLKDGVVWLRYRFHKRGAPAA